MLFLVALTAYREVTDETFKKVVTGGKHVLMKYYTTDCIMCEDMDPGFDEASTKFDESVIIFAGVNCTEYKDLCKAEEVENTPAIKIFIPGRANGLVYDGDKNCETFCDFIEQSTLLKASGAKKSPLIEVTAFNIEKFGKMGTCNFVAFYNINGDKNSIAHMRKVAETYEPEPDVNIGLFNCARHTVYCEEKNMTLLPAMYVIRDDQWIVVDEAMWARFLVMHINEICDKHRELGGLLDANAGTVKEADKLSEKFFDGRNKLKVIEKIRKIPGAEFYAKVMEQIIAKGKKAVEESAEKLNELLLLHKGSWSVLDEMQKRYNVFMKVVPTPRPPEEDDYYGPDDMFSPTADVDL